MSINPYLALTADNQYMRDQYYSIPGAEGVAYSLKATVNFYSDKSSDKSYPAKVIMLILDDASLNRVTGLRGYGLLRQTIVDTETMCLERTWI